MKPTPAISVRNISSLPGVLAGLCAVCVWSLMPVLVKHGINDIHITYFLVLRFAAASLLLLPLVARVFRKASVVAVRTWVMFAAVAGGDFLLQTLALKGLPVSYFIVLGSLHPLLTLLLMRIGLTREILVWVILAAIGTLFFAYIDEFIRTVSLFPLLALFGAMVTWAASTALIGHFQTAYDDLEITAITSGVGLVTSLGAWLAMGLPTVPLSAAQYANVAVLAVGFPVAFFLFAYSLRRVPVFGVTVQYLEPIFGLLIAILAAGERLTLAQYIGAVIVIAATSRIALVVR